MKVATIELDGSTQAAVVDDEMDRAWPLRDIVGTSVPTVLDAVRRWDELEVLVRGPRPGPGRLLAGLKLCAPIPRPARNIFCVGKNYFEHAKEFHNSDVFDDAGRAARNVVPDRPIVFSKVPESVVGPGDVVRYPDGVSDSIDYEAELGVIIGIGGRGISAANALRHVWGYTIINDVTARDLQKLHDQWHISKSLDTFCPMGPWAVTADAIDASAVEVLCWVNGDLRQKANTRDLIFSIPKLIESISAGITLLPGDIIATGTPAGVGIGFTPPRYLRPGDEIAIEIKGIGRLVNRIARID